MSTISPKDGTQLYDKDWGTGQPAVFSYGWPLRTDVWEDQMFFLAEAEGKSNLAEGNRPGEKMDRPR